MALLERLQILIDADGQGLVREFDKAGREADKLDAKLKSGAEKTSARLTSIGTNAVIGGAAVIGGLYKLAQASDEAEKQQLKLEKGSAKTSARLQSIGSKAAIGGAVVVGGLAGLVELADRALGVCVNEDLQTFQECHGLTLRLVEQPEAADGLTESHVWGPAELSGAPDDPGVASAAAEPGFGMPPS